MYAKLMFFDLNSGRGSMGRRKQVAVRISDTVVSVLPYMRDEVIWDSVFIYKMETVNLTR